MIVSWNTTNQCNMFCDHCYRDAGCKRENELSTEQGKTMIDQIAEAGFKIMIFSGGEPLMRPDIVELVRHARGRGLRPVFGSNGTLLTPELARELKSAGTMGMGISLDSLDPARHDELRRFAGGWDGAVRGMRVCREVGLPFQVHTTVFDWNRDELEGLTDFAVKEGAVAHHFFFLVPTGRGAGIVEESLDAAQYEETITRIMEKQRQVKIELKPTCAPHFMRIAQEMGMDLRFGRGCLAGTSYCIIGPTGQVQPCAYLDINLGDVRETSFVEIWRHHPVLRTLRTLDYKGFCGPCEYKKICGGCRARAAVYHDGDYMAEEPWCLYRERREQEAAASAGRG